MAGSKSVSKSPEKEETPLVDRAEEVKVDTEEQKTEDETRSADKAESDKEPEAKETEESDKKSKGGSKKKVTGAAAASKKKKASAAAPRILNANPGEHYLVKLKGFPAWPAIIADEDMLPTQLLSTRPVTAKRADGTYREDYADGGKRQNDRTFPVMYLATNEFGWVPNTILSELSVEKAKETNTTKMRRDLQEAFSLAAENHSIQYYKDLLQSFQEEMVAAEEAAKEEAERKAKSSLEVPDDDAPKKTKKRKASDDAKADSKKPKIKLSVGKTNGEKTRAAKPKQAPKKPADKEVALPTLTQEERHERKEKEVRFCRHKLQKGLLTRDVKPKAEEMPSMNEYLSKLEGRADLEVSIIRATKINKVLKAILKLESIPRDEEFKFKVRSSELLAKWNKLLAADAAANGHDSKANGKEEEAGDLTVIGDRTMKVAEAEVEGEKAEDEA